MTTVDSSIEVANEKTLQVHTGVANVKLSTSTCEPWIYATDRHPIRAHQTVTLVCDSGGPLPKSGVASGTLHIMASTPSLHHLDPSTHQPSINQELHP